MIPTLSANGKEVLTDDRDIIIYLIKMFSINPGDISVFNQLSLRVTETKYDAKIDAFCGAIENELNHAIKRNIINSNYTVECKYEYEKHEVDKLKANIKVKAEYKIKISVFDSSGVLVLTHELMQEHFNKILS